MSPKRIIPCLDIRDGLTVKGIRFLDTQKVGDPVVLAADYTAEGADELVILDIISSPEGRKQFVELVQRVAGVITIPLIAGGGIATLRDARELLEAGASKVSINSAAVRNPRLIDEISSRFGSHSVVLAIDGAQNRNGQWEVIISGGKINSGKELLTWAKEGENRGAGEILFTSMDHDGTRDGFPCGVLAQLSDYLTIPVIASGGAGTMEHFREVLTLGKADAALAASVFHYRQITIPQLKEFLHNQGVIVSNGPI